MKIKNKNKHKWLELITDIANECDMSLKQVIAFQDVLGEHLEGAEGLEIVENCVMIDDFYHPDRWWLARKVY